MACECGMGKGKGLPSGLWHDWARVSIKLGQCPAWVSLSRAGNRVLQPDEGGRASFARATNIMVVAVDVRDVHYYAVYGQHAAAATATAMCRNAQAIELRLCKPDVVGAILPPTKSRLLREQHEVPRRGYS